MSDSPHGSLLVPYTDTTYFFVRGLGFQYETSILLNINILRVVVVRLTAYSCGDIQEQTGLSSQRLWPDLQYHPSTPVGTERHDTKIETLEIEPTANQGHGNNDYYGEEVIQYQNYILFQKQFWQHSKRVKPPSHTT
jgi:hypothetical protein